jgi:hypothetical protein
LKDEEERLRKISDSFLTKPLNKLKLIKELKKYIQYIEKTKKVTEKSKEKATEEKVLSNEEKAELIKILEEEHYKEWESVSKTRAMGNVKTFAINLQKTAEKYGSVILKKYSSELFESVSSFKVAKVKTMLNDFPKIIHIIKNV